MNTSNIDHFKVLKLRRTTSLTKKIVKNAYKSLAQKLHPDKLITKDSTPEDIMRYNEAFERLSESYEFILKHIEEDTLSTILLQNFEVIARETIVSNLFNTHLQQSKIDNKRRRNQPTNYFYASDAPEDTKVTFPKKFVDIITKQSHSGIERSEEIIQECKEEKSYVYQVFSFYEISDTKSCELIQTETKHRIIQINQRIKQEVFQMRVLNEVVRLIENGMIPLHESNEEYVESIEDKRTTYLDKL